MNNNDSRLDCSNMPEATRVAKEVCEEKKICPIMSAPLVIPFREVDISPSRIQIIHVDCFEERCAMWLNESCGFGLVLNRPPVPIPEVSKVQHERPRSGIGSVYIISKKE